MPHAATEPAGWILPLAFGSPDAGALAALDAAAWAEIDELARQHRLQPWLAERHANTDLPIPAELRERWGNSRRLAALTALSQRADLLAASRLLDDAGIRSVALKGPWYAWYAYPAPAMRPMNDLDMLVPAEQALAAFEHLLAAGWVQTRPFEQGLDHALAHDKHLPQISSPSDTVLELHMRCWTDGAPSRDAEILARARPMERADPLLYPAARDLFAHLVIHATGHGRLDCGPLGLLDLDRLIERERLDWPALLAEAEEEGWLRPAALLLALTERWLRPGLVALAGCPLRVPEAVLDTAERLMVQDLSTCREAQFLADLSAAAASGTLLSVARHRLFGRAPDSAPAARDFSREGGYGAWLGDRVKRTVTGLLGSRVRRQASGYRVISSWCAGA